MYARLWRKFLQRREMPPEVVRLADIPGAHPSLEAVQAVALALRHCRAAFFGRSGVQRTEECRMGVSAALYAECLGHRGVALARLTEGDHLLVEGVLWGLGVRPAWTGFALAHAPRAFTVPVGGGHVGSGHERSFRRIGVPRQGVTTRSVCKKNREDRLPRYPTHAECHARDQ